MVKFLAIANELFDQIVLGSHTPEPIPGIIWAYFSRAKHHSSKILNSKAVWIGFDSDKLAQVSEEKLSITFKEGTAKILDYPSKLPGFSVIELRSKYQVKEKHCQISLFFPCPNYLIFPPPPCNTRVNRTVFVDVKYGNDITGQIENRCYPFQSINAAISAIPPQVSTIPNFVVKVAPGIYNEDVKLSSGLELLGTDNTATIIRSLLIEGKGSNLVKNLQISSPSQPALAINYNQSNNPNNGPIQLQSLIILSTVPSNNNGLPVVEIKQSIGKGGVISFNSVLVEGNYSSNSFPGVLVTSNNLSSFEDSDLELQLNNSTFLATLSNNSLENIILLDFYFTRTFTDGILLHIRGTPALEMLPVQIFGGEFNLDNSRIKIRVSESDSSEILLFRATDASINVNNISADLQGIPQNSRYLAEALGESTKIVLLSINFNNGETPKLKGNLDQIFHVAQTSGANLVSNGALFTKSRFWSINPQILKNDSLILMDVGNLNIDLPDPVLEETEAISRGRQLTFKNVSDRFIHLFKHIYGYPDDVAVLLPPKKSVTFQTNGVLWYIIGEAENELAPNTGSFGGVTGPGQVTVPAGYSTVTFTAYAAAGYSFEGESLGGFGNSVQGTFSVTPGDIYYLYVGTPGQRPDGGLSGGEGNGGKSGEGGIVRDGGGGGGESSVRFGGQGLSDRILVAGGGGGAGNLDSGGAGGGNGDYPIGDTGSGANPGLGGTQVSGGTGGWFSPLANGGFGFGGNGESGEASGPGGGGGGGYYGGGGGAIQSGGGGGASFILGANGQNLGPTIQSPIIKWTFYA